MMMIPTSDIRHKIQESNYCISRNGISTIKATFKTKLQKQPFADCTMNRGSLNMALKKGVSTERIANRQILHASEHNRKRRDELIQKKRGVGMNCG